MTDTFSHDASVDAFSLSVVQPHGLGFLLFIMWTNGMCRCLSSSWRLGHHADPPPQKSCAFLCQTVHALQAWLCCGVGGPSVGAMAAAASMQALMPPTVPCDQAVSSFGPLSPRRLGSLEFGCASCFISSSRVMRCRSPFHRRSVLEIG